MMSTATTIIMMAETVRMGGMCVCVGYKQLCVILLFEPP